MSKIMLLVFSILLCSTLVLAQTGTIDSTKSETSETLQSYFGSVQLEFAGTGLLYNVSYEHTFLKGRLRPRIGYGYLLLQEEKTEKSMHLMAFPVGCSYLFPFAGGLHNFELGTGLMNFMLTGDMVEYEGHTDFYLNPWLLLGYRAELRESPWLFRVHVLPFIASKSLIDPTEKKFRPIIPGDIQPFAGLGVGYRF